MRAALLCLLACAAACALPAACAGAPPDVPRAVGYEVGGFRWYEKDVAAYVISVGRWQRLGRAVTWQTRLQHADLAVLDFGKARIPESKEWYDLGHSVTLQTGIAVHPPVVVGLAPYLGVSLGAGLVRGGDRYQAHLEPEGWQTSVERHHASFGFSTGLEIGLRLFSKPGWPTVCMTLGGRVVNGLEGGGFTAEPLLSIGY